MREIKFRAWDKKEKRMYEWPFITHFFGEKIRVHKEGYGYIHIPMDDIELLQFTELKDKNGKEIYEGDILMYRNNMSVKNPGVPFDSYHKVCFGEYDFGEYEDQEDGYGWYKQDIDVENYGSSLTPISSDMYEVIGNIYENPELLT